ncbi:hypothetical protein OF117_03070 [Geodermatophilus sp. YIM 151500]|uniref:hypothetical protein n=1 Tax=Geodermatophilus sp. YIM 151500 TaxID=2984531 RepID=UPI0021E3DA25|nr:hypothetical protein [Geodermatophilus sp. YIM 151500]MCV2488332.1 hypothetical protein [Geodermatophilus sp. YIM 151500]
MVTTTSVPGSDPAPGPARTAAGGPTSGTGRASALDRGRAGVRASVPEAETWSCPNCRGETRAPRKRCADCGTSRY